jgi:hypothetical protein
MASPGMNGAYSICALRETPGRVAVRMATGSNLWSRTDKPCTHVPQRCDHLTDG